MPCSCVLAQGRMRFPGTLRLKNTLDETRVREADEAGREGGEETEEEGRLPACPLMQIISLGSHKVAFWETASLAGSVERDLELLPSAEILFIARIDLRYVGDCFGEAFAAAGKVSGWLHREEFVLRGDNALRPLLGVGARALTRGPPIVGCRSRMMLSFSSSSERPHPHRNSRRADSLSSLAMLQFR